MTPRGRQRSSDEHGMILVMVLWLVAIMTVLVVALNSYARNSLSLAGIEADRLRNRAIIESGIDAAVGIVLATPAPRRLLFAGAPKSVDLGSGATVEIAITDASAVIDINRADKKFLAALPQHLDVPEAAGGAITDAILKWRETVTPDTKPEGGQTGADAQPGQPQDQSGQQTQGGGSGDAAQPGDQPPAPAKQAQSVPGAFFSLAQLYSVPGVNAADVDKFLPFVGLYSKDGKVNPMAAPQPVLQSVPDITARQLNAIASARAMGRSDDPTLQQIVGQFAPFLALNEPKSFVISVKGVSGPGVIPGSLIEVVAVLDPSGAPVYRLLGQSW